MRRLCLALAFVATTLSVPSWCHADDQAIAQQIMNVFKQTGVLSDQEDDIAVRYSEGTAYLRGTVHSKQQITTAIEIAQASPYVERVVNEIQLGSNVSSGSTRSARPIAKSPKSTAIQTSLTEEDTPDSQVQTAVPHRVVRQARDDSGASGQQSFISAHGPQGNMPVPAAPSGLGMDQPTRLAQMPPAQMMNRGAAAMARPMAMGPGGMPQPAYVPGTGGGVARAAYDQPAMPNYAWPSYAAYPNYAALTYPKQYSPTAWPYIGPFYPYPQVPMGWRKVTLQWQDGWWFLDFKQ